MGKESDLLDAARSGNIAIVEKLLSSKSKSKWPTSIQTLGFLKGPNVNCQDQNGETPLHFAALNNHKEIVELLLKYQASANIPDQKGCYPLHLAAWRGNFEICQILLTNGPSVAIINNQNLDGDTALHSASQYGHTEVVNVLLQKCANPLIKNNKGEKALDLAVMFGRQETVEKLLASPDSKIYLNLTKQDRSPLHLAAKSGNVNVVRMLLSAGFDVNHQTDSGTALHEASLHGKLEVFKLLLSQGGDVMLTNSSNKTTIDLLNELSNPVSLDMKKLALDFDNEKIKTAQKNIDAAKYFSVGEDYDVLPKVAGRQQAMDSISRLSRNSVGSSTSSVFQGTGEEESIYDCPQAGARALYPLPGAAKVPLNSSSFNKIDKPNTPKKPPRKKVANSSSKTVDKQTAVDLLPDCNRNTPTGSCPSDGTDGMTSNYGTPVGSFNSNKTSTGSASTRIPTPPSKPLAPAAIADRSESVAPGFGLSPRISSVHVRSSPASNSPPVSVGSTQSPRELNLGTRPDNLSMTVKGVDAPCEPPTPDHPPPSPETALLDIQQLINSERRKSRDMHTSTEFDEPNASVQRPLWTSASRRETFHNVCRNSPSKEPNNNNSIFHGLTLGSSPLSTISPTRKSSRMLRFNHLINSRTLPSFLPSIASRNAGKDGSMSCDSHCPRINRSSKDPGSSLHFDSSRSQRISSHVVAEVDGTTDANKEDWTQLEHLFKTSLTGGLETLMSEFDKRMTTILSGQSSNSILSVTDWLESIDMIHLENVLIVNGFDDMQFMSLLEVGDMEEIGITSEEQRSVLLKHCKSMPSPPEPCFDSLREWLESLRLTEYFDTFASHGCSEISQIFDFTDSPLQNTFKYMLPGHRKRVKNSAQWYCSKFSKIKKIESATGVTDHRTSDARYRRPESLITGCCNFTVRYLGSKEVSVADGSDPPKLAIAKIKQDSLACIEEMPTVTLSVSYLGVRFIDLTNKMVICSHDISNIFSASQGEDCLNYFAYITQSVDDGPFLCHVFHARSEELAREIMMTLGEAFYVAYQLAVREQNPVVGANLKKLNASTEDSAAPTSLGNPVSVTTEIKHKHHSFQSRSTEI